MISNYTIRAVFIIYGFFSSVTYASSKDVLLSSDEWCPFVCDPKSSKPGTNVEIVLEILKRNKIASSVRIAPWSRSIHDARTGKINGILGALIGDAPDFVFPKEKIGFAKNCFFVDKNSIWNYEDIKSFNNVTVAGIQDYSYDSDGPFDQLLSTGKKNNSPKVKVLAQGGLERLVKLLQQKRVQVVVEEYQVFNYFLRENKIPDTFKNAGCLNGTDMHIAFSPSLPNSKDLAELISKGVTELREDGTLENILKKYSLNDWR